MPATNPFLIDTRCLPRWRRADPRSRSTRRAPIAPPRSTASPTAGVDVRRTRSADGGLTVEIEGRGLRGLRAPASPLDARNSGTTMRLLSGVLAAHPFTSVLIGDASLTRRPMGRVIVPLELMGARIESHDRKPPLTIHGAALKGIRYRTEVPSAQIKSAVLLAGLQAEGTTIVEESAATRNHTELALRAFGASGARLRQHD